MHRLLHIFPAILLVTILTGCSVREHFWTSIEAGSAFIHNVNTQESVPADESVLFKCFQMGMDGRGGFEADGLTDLAD